MSQTSKKEMMKEVIEKVKDKLTADEMYRFAVISSYATRQGSGMSFIQVADLIKEVTGQEVNPDDVQMSNERL